MMIEKRPAAPTQNLTRNLTRILTACVGLTLTAGALLPAAGCSTAYYRTMEYFGKEKRDILATRVKDAKADQIEAKQQFQSSLERFSALVNAPNSDLKKAYDKAKSDLEKSESKASAVHDRVKSVESVGTDLFEEWKTENQAYSDASLKSKSEQLLRGTRAKYDDMLAAMQKSEATMEPVLVKFRDNVRFMKSNLNAQAVSAMKGNVSDLQRDIGTLIQEMETSIAESDKFINELQK